MCDWAHAPQSRYLINIFSLACLLTRSMLSIDSPLVAMAWRPPLLIERASSLASKSTRVCRTRDCISNLSASEFAGVNKNPGLPFAISTIWRATAVSSASASVKGPIFGMTYPRRNVMTRFFPLVVRSSPASCITSDIRWPITNASSIAVTIGSPILCINLLACAVVIGNGCDAGDAAALASKNRLIFPSSGRSASPMIFRNVWNAIQYGPRCSATFLNCVQRSSGA